MKSATRVVVTLALAALVASSALAQEKGKKKRSKKKGQQRASVVQLLRIPREIQATFTEEQKKQIAALNKEFAPKMAALREKQQGLLTPEQRRAQRNAATAAKEAGKKGKEARAAVDAAVKLTDEQKKQQVEYRKMSAELRGEVQKKLMPLLTPEQKAKMPKRGQGQAKKKGAKKRKKKNDQE